MRPRQVVSGALAARRSVGGDPTGRERAPVRGSVQGGSVQGSSVLGQAAAQGREPAAASFLRDLDGL